MDKPVIATELIKGQGLGNQIFCYITTRALAYDKGYDFAILNSDLLAVVAHSNKGMYFMDMDCGLDMKKEDFTNIYNEKEDRLHISNSIHDMKLGCYITGCDEHLLNLNESTLVYGNMQDEAYFKKYKKEIKEWLKVKPEYDCKEFSRDNLCVINIRGGEYACSPELFLRRKYWLDAMSKMREIRRDMEFVVITDDVNDAKRILPEVEAYHFDLAKDYTSIKNAHYLILSNSSFAFFPAFTSDTVKYIIAPKYWARHNVSDGYWASEQNIYEDFHYMDRDGKIFTAEECRKELAEYKRTSKKYKTVGQPLSSLRFNLGKINIMRLKYKDLSVRAVRSAKRRLLKK